ncbi:MAG: hypothetical protein ACLGIK_12415, partial [Gemmatimonadota bacterium]
MTSRDQGHGAERHTEPLPGGASEGNDDGATAWWDRELEALRARFDVAETTIACAGRSFTLAHPRNADTLISEDDYVKDE